MDVRKALLGWPLVRQLTGRDRLGRGRRRAVAGDRAPTVARTETADRVVQSVCPYCAVGCGQRVYVKDEQGHPDRGRPRLADLAAAGCAPRARPASSWSTRPAGRPTMLYRRPHGTEWEPLDLETATDMIADRVIETRARTWQDTRRAGPVAAPHAGHRRPRRRDARQRRELPDQEALHRAWARSRSRTRPVFDTAPPSPVWGPRSVVAAPPPSCRTCRTPTASSSRARTWPSATRSGSSG